MINLRYIRFMIGNMESAISDDIYYSQRNTTSYQNRMLIFEDYQDAISDIAETIEDFLIGEAISITLHIANRKQVIL